MSLLSGGFNPFGSWDSFVSTVNRAGFSWKNLLGQDRAETWKPGMSFGNGTTGITYDNQLGNFVKIGRLVVANYKLILSSKGSDTGIARITGLPAMVAPVAASDVFSSIGYWNAMTSSLVSMSIGVEVGKTTGQIFGVTSAATEVSAMTDTDFADASSIQGVLMYYASR